MMLQLVTTLTLLLCLTVSCPAVAVESGALNLELASVLFRHGDRSPVRTFPNDPYKEFDWPQGFGQLSIVGMQQQYHLGQLLKSRYIDTGFIYSNYTRVQVRVRSTDVDRTLMSVASQLSALFPPNQPFEDHLPWQPIPIHTAQLPYDTLLRPLDNCPAYHKLSMADKETAEYKEIEKLSQDFFAKVKNETGLPNVNLSNIWIVEDTIKIENISANYTPPDWATPDVLKTLTNLSGYTMTLMFKGKEKNRLSAGMWLQKILTDMKNKVNPSGNQTLEDMKLFLYSAHDTTVAAMTSALQVFNERLPGYASAFAVELYSDSNGGYYVRMLYRDGPDSSTFDLLNATYCKNATLCTLEEFEAFVTPLIPSDIMAACGLSSSTDLEEQNKTLKIYVIALGSALTFTVTFALILLVIAITCCRKKSKNYTELNA